MRVYASLSSVIPGKLDCSSILKYFVPDPRSFYDPIKVDP